MTASSLDRSDALNPTLTVTDAGDVYDPSDDRLTLREAVEQANARPGLDVIDFSDDFLGPVTLGGDPELVTDGLVVTDDLIVEGGTRGQTVIATANVYGPSIEATFDALGADLLVENVVLRESGYIGVRARDGANVTLDSVTIDGSGGYLYAYGVVADGGGVTLIESTIQGVAAGDGISGAAQVRNGGELALVRSTVSGDNAEGVPAFDVEGTLVLDGSTVSGSSVRDAAALISVDGRLEAVNSTIAENSASSDAALIELEGGSGELTNVTIAANILDDGRTIVVADDAELVLNNSIVLANPGLSGEAGIEGEVVSQGGNVFGPFEVEGASPADAAAYSFDVFEPGIAIDFIDRPGVELPILDDNGGPTRTIALREDPSNPAIGQARPENAPATDQRGLPRDAEPDAGAFEAATGGGGSNPDALPELTEKEAVPEEALQPIDAGLFRADGQVAPELTFEGGVGAQNNSLGFYVVEDDGSFGDTFLLFEDDKTVAPDTGFALPTLDDGQTLGLFLIADGGDLNDFSMFSGEASLVFLDQGGGEADVFERRPGLFVEEADGSLTEVEGRVLHAFDFDLEDEGNSLNPQDGLRAIAGRDEDGDVTVAFEDKAFDPDLDFNDLVVSLGGFVDVM